MKTYENIVEEIIQYFEENDDIFVECIEELDDYNGYLGDDRYHNMEEIDEFYGNEDPSEVLMRAFYGYDTDLWHVDKWGEAHYDAFNPNRDFFRVNAYGNLVSSSYKDYSGKLDEYVIEKMEECRAEVDMIDSTPELCELFDELENTAKQFPMFSKGFYK